MRYKLRSLSKTAPSSSHSPQDSAVLDVTDPNMETECEHNSPCHSPPSTSNGNPQSLATLSEDASAAEESNLTENNQGLNTPPVKRQRCVRRKRKTAHSRLSSSSSTQVETCQEVCNRSPNVYAHVTGLTDLPLEVLLHITKELDTRSMLALLRTCKWLYDMLRHSNSYWKDICVKEELSNYPCLFANEEEEEIKQVSEESANPKEGNSKDEFCPSTPPGVSSFDKVGWAGKPMRVRTSKDLPKWRRIFLRGLQMRRNICAGNWEGWRIYANDNVPVVKLDPELNFNRVKRKMGPFPKLSQNDDLKIDWDEKHLVVFHFYRREGESCAIKLWDISDDPKFLYEVQKGVEGITDKVSIMNDHVVIVPSWPLEAGALVMTLDLKDGMKESGKFLFSDQGKQNSLDENWDHTQLRVIKNEAMVVCQSPRWTIIVVNLPGCELLFELDLPQIPTNYECQQIRSYKQTAMILFAKRSDDSANILVTVDVGGASTKVRSVYECKNVADVALFTDPEEIYIMKRNGDVTMFDANAMTETVKIPNDDPEVSCQSSASSNANNVWWPPLQQQPPPALPPGEAAAAAPMEVVEAAPLEANEHQNEAVLDQAINNDEQAGNDEQQPAAEEGQQLAVIPAAEQHQHPPLPELVNVDPQQQQVQPANTHPPTSEYQLFVNRKEQICVMQSASEVPQGRNIKVYTYSQRRLYTIDLDLAKYGVSRDESICIYTNGAFLAAADSKKFIVFNVHTGAYLGSMEVPSHLERNKGKEEKDCMFEQTGLSLFIFDEDKLIAVHDYERNFPAVLDIYKFW